MDVVSVGGRRRMLGLVGKREEGSMHLYRRGRKKGELDCGGVGWLVQVYNWVEVSSGGVTWLDEPGNLG